MAGKLVKFTLPDDVYDHFAARAQAHDQTINEFLRAALITSLTAKQQSAKPPLARTTVEPRWKTKDKPKTQ